MTKSGRGSFPAAKRCGGAAPGISLAATPPQGPPPPLGAAVTGDELAGLLGIAPRTVRELAGRGLVLKAGRGRYNLAVSVSSYCSHLREQAAGRAGDAQAGLATERARQAKEMADNIALKNAALRGDLVSAAQVTAEWSGVLRRVRARILAVPARVQQSLAFLKQHDVGVIDAELRQALTELGGDGASA